MWKLGKNSMHVFFLLNYIYVPEKINPAEFLFDFQNFGTKIFIISSFQNKIYKKIKVG